MQILIYVFATVFIFLALVLLLFTYPKTGHAGVLLLAVIYGASAVLAIVIMQAWPLLAGFVLAWGVRLLGLEPDAVDRNKTDGSG